MKHFGFKDKTTVDLIREGNNLLLTVNTDKYVLHDCDSPKIDDETQLIYIPETDQFLICFPSTRKPGCVICLNKDSELVFRNDDYISNVPEGHSSTPLFQDGYYTIPIIWEDYFYSNDDYYYNIEIEVYNTSGQRIAEILSPLYLRTGYYDDFEVPEGTLIVSNGNTYGLYTKLGKPILPHIFNYLAVANPRFTSAIYDMVGRGWNLDNVMLNFFVYRAYHSETSLLGTISFDGTIQSMPMFNAFKCIDSEYRFVLGIQTIEHHHEYSRAIKKIWLIRCKDGSLVNMQPYSMVIKLWGHDSTLFLVKKDAYIGVLDDNGNTIIQPRYDKISPYLHKHESDFHKEGNRLIFRAILKGKMGVIDDTEAIIIPFNYKWIWGTSLEKPFIVQGINGLYGLISKNGQILECIYQRYSILPGSFYRESGIGTYISSNGVVLADNFESIRISKSRLYAILQIDGKYGITKLDGNQDVTMTPFEKVKFVWDDILNKDFVAVENDGKWGLADISLNIKVPFIYDEIRHIDIDLNPAPCGDLELHNYHHVNHIVVRLGNYFNVIDSDGKLLLESWTTDKAVVGIHQADDEERLWKDNEKRDNSYEPYEYSQEELDSMYKSAYEGDSSLQWNND